MSLLSKPIKEITYKDVVKFCERRIKEGDQLDYKADISKDLAKEVCAFANTKGGIIIIGVNEYDGHPISPFEGIKYEQQLEERVTQKISSVIKPHVSFEIQVCPPQNDKTFVIIKIPPSPSTPHAIVGKKGKGDKIYIRRGTISEPARVDDLEWLYSNRFKSISLRKSIKKNIRDGFERIYKHYQTFLVTPTNNFIDATGFEICSSVLYPDNPYTTVDFIAEIANEHHKENGISVTFKITEKTGTKNYPWNLLKDRGISEFIESNRERIRRRQSLDCHFKYRQNGVVFWYNNGNEIVITELNIYGIFLWKKYLSRRAGIDLDLLVCLVKASLVSLHKFYRLIGYSGPIEIDIRLERLMHNEIYASIIRENSIIPIKTKNFTEKEIDVSSHLMHTEDLKQEEIALDLCRKLYRSFGFELPIEVFKKCIILE